MRKIGAYDCTTAGPDGYLDLSLRFQTQAVAAALGPVFNCQVLVLELTGSPAIDAGTSLGAPPVGIDGERRPMGAGVDIGADEVPVR